MGWHVYYRAERGMGVRLVGDREIAIDTACALMGEGREIVRITTHDRADTIHLDAIKSAGSAIKSAGAERSTGGELVLQPRGD